MNFGDKKQVLSVLNNLKYEINLTLTKPQTNIPHTFFSLFLSLLTSILLYSTRTRLNQIGCQFVIMCDNINTNLFRMLDMIHLWWYCVWNYFILLSKDKPQIFLSILFLELTLFLKPCLGGLNKHCSCMYKCLCIDFIIQTFQIMPL